MTQRPVTVFNILDLRPYCAKRATVWDQTTYARRDPDNEFDLIEVPSRAPFEGEEGLTGPLPVVGDYTANPIGFTLAEFVELNQRCIAFDMRANFPFTATVGENAVVIEGYDYVGPGEWTPTNDPISAAAISLDSEEITGKTRRRRGTLLDPPKAPPFDPPLKEDELGCQLSWDHFAPELETQPVITDTTSDSTSRGIVTNYARRTVLLPAAFIHYDFGYGYGYGYGTTYYADEKFWPRIPVEFVAYLTASASSIRDVRSGPEPGVAEEVKGQIFELNYRWGHAQQGENAANVTNTPMLGDKDLTLEIKLSEVTLSGKLCHNKGVDSLGRVLFGELWESPGNSPGPPAISLSVSAPTVAYECRDFFDYASWGNGPKYNATTGVKIR